MTEPAEKLSSDAAELFARVRKLPEGEQRLFAFELRQAAVHELSQAWKNEIARRVQKLKDGTAVLHDGDEVFERLLAKYPE